ncbi:MAG: type I DNA topoisomerase [Chloroherpetonaceae bacterium]|nr:type I DNA topoisomerase [Chloroherpetonaceae bacterium]MDW8437726.1 type I DNA topoisomerase [Chloroherpetonaceae bacterium]
MATKKSSSKPAEPKREGGSASKGAETATASAKGKRLVIVESPAKAKTINKYLGKDYAVFASMGHIKDLPRKEIGLDFERHYEPHYEIIEGKEKVVREMKKLAKESSEIFLATDPDREGEAIAWHIANEVQEARKPIRRAVFNEITEKAVREAIQHPRDIDYKLVRSQQARQALDKIVGYKVSPFLWDTVLHGLSAGRVQSVALRLVCEREDEIEAFKPKEYWSIYADFVAKSGDVVTAKLVKINGKDFELSNEADAKAVAEKIKARLYSILEIKKRKVRRNPPPPFTTSLLQQAASNQLGFGSKQTMRLAQQLYEGIELGGEGAVGLITYMRTDSKRVSKEAQAEARDFISRHFGKEFVPETATQFKTAETAQDAHEAIRPTSVDRLPKAIEKFLAKDQFKLYELVWKRFLASQMAAAEFEQTSVDIGDDNGEFLFRATGSVVLFEGFLKVYGDARELDYEERKSTKEDDGEEERGAILPKSLAENDPMKLADVKPNQHFTKPPARYTEASLVKELDNYGIGRPSTYATILSTLVERGYVENRNRRLFPTELGRDVCKILVANFAELFNTDFTAKMEADLDKVASGETDYEKLLNDFYLPFEAALQARSKDPILPFKEGGDVCDKCGKGRMLVKWTKSGKFLSCSRYPKCDNAKSLSLKKAAPQETGIRCYKCETGRMLVRNGKFGRFLACSNYPDCDAILNLDKNGRVAPPKTPPLETDARCPKCDAPMYLRDGKRGLWLSCTRFPKCRGARSWKQIGEEMGEDAQRKFEAMHQEHSKRHPPVELKLLDGSPLDLNAKLDDLVALQNESGAPVGVESSVGDDAPF